MKIEDIKTPGDVVTFIDSEILEARHKHYLNRIKDAVHRLYYTDHITLMGEFIDKVNQAVCSVTGINKEALYPRNRKRELVQCRQLIWFILKLNTDKSLSTIGQLFNRDHATALHGIRTIQNYIDTKDYDTIYYLQKIKKMFAKHEQDIDNGL